MTSEGPNKSHFGCNPIFRIFFFSDMHTLYFIKRNRRMTSKGVIPDQQNPLSRNSSANISSSTKRRSTFRFVPTIAHELSDWLDFPVGKTNGVLFNSITLPFKWLLWTNKSLAALTPDSNVRERLCNQSLSLGSVAGLYLVISVAAFLTPPGFIFMFLIFSCLS